MIFTVLLILISVRDCKVDWSIVRRLVRYFSQFFLKFVSCLVLIVQSFLLISDCELMRFPTH